MARVLMLGWEFPPLISGGLAVATYGLVKELSKHHSLILFIPKAGQSDLEAVQIIGLNKITSQRLEEERIRNNLSFPNTELQEVPLALSPYHEVNQALHDQDVWSRLRQGGQFLETILEIFDNPTAYGWDIIHKVHLYATLVTELAADKQVDLIHAHDWVTYPAGVMLKQRFKVPLILHVHSLETDRAGQSCKNEIYQLEKAGLQQADQIIAVSEYTRQQLILHYGIEPNRIAVIHNGVEPILTQRVRKNIKEKIVLFLGRITHQKGPYALIETAAKVIKKNPHVKFVVAGTGDQFAYALESAAYRQLGKHFIFTGFQPRDRVEQLLGMADVYFMPSVSEPFGLTALEAAQYKVPSVLSNQSGVAEVIRAALKADFWDTDKFAHYILALLRYPVLGNVLANRAAEEVQAITWAAAAEKISTIYRQALPATKPF